MLVMAKTMDLQRLKSELLDVQRWEDEGGQMIDNNAPLPVPLASINAGRHHESLQWNQRFVIEPFQPNNIVFPINKNLQRIPATARKIHRKGNPNG
jgi:hypothetical protein